ncbi:MAG: helix-turn-helix transcriptional regulator [Clostridia bacterium]|nr:helix-turn-helix transcriptional regulator [Clostridia bacterium]
MPFVQIDVNKEIEKRMENQEFKKAWEENHAEYKLIGEMISLRKQKKITQSELAKLTGNKQQVISRIERKENNPSLKLFTHILDVLGYELRIVKKRSSM